jgi:hypothetical protein
MSGDNFKRATLSVMFMFIILLSYGPLVEEIATLAGNATTDNAVISFLDSWFGHFWVLLAIFFLMMGIYYLLKGF